MKNLQADAISHNRKALKGEEPAQDPVDAGDRSSALSYTGTDVFDRGYYVLRKWFPIRGDIADYHRFLASVP